MIDLPVSSGTAEAGPVVPWPSGFTAGKTVSSHRSVPVTPPLAAEEVNEASNCMLWFGLKAASWVVGLTDRVPLSTSSPDKSTSK